MSNRLDSKSRPPGRLLCVCRAGAADIRYEIEDDVHIGFTQKNDKLEFVEPSERVIPNQFAFLVWESPSNFGQPIVIQTALFVPLSGIFPREVVLLTRRLPRQFENWLAMTGKSAARQIPISRSDRQRLFCSSQIISTAMSAGLTPEIRLAWPRDTGRMASSFCRASSRSPPMAL